MEDILSVIDRDILAASRLRNKIAVDELLESCAPMCWSYIIDDVDLYMNHKVRDEGGEDVDIDADVYPSSKTHQGCIKKRCGHEKCIQPQNLISSIEEISTRYGTRIEICVLDAYSEDELPDSISFWQVEAYRRICGQEALCCDGYEQVRNQTYRRRK